MANWLADFLFNPNPSQPPLIRGGVSFTLPLTRGSWRGLGYDSRFFGMNNPGLFQHWEALYEFIG